MHCEVSTVIKRRLFEHKGKRDTDQWRAEQALEGMSY